MLVGCGAVALLGGLLATATAAPPVAAASCPRELPVRVQTSTTNATALRRVGFVSATSAPGVRVRDLRVTLTRDGRTIAQGSRERAFGGRVGVRVAFGRKAGPGAVNLVVSGRVAGCAERRRRARTRVLDGRDLPLSVTGTDQDLRGGRLSVMLRGAGGRSISRVRARILDARGATISVHTRRAALRTRARLEFALRRQPVPGPYSLLVTGALDDAGRSTFADTIELDGAVAPAKPGTPGAAPAPAADPDRGATVQEVGVDWSGGDWKGHDSTGFSAPGIGEGQLVCRPDTQWLRFYPSDRTRDVAMTLWSFRDWEGGSEYAIRESEMTQFTGPEFNEGFNKFKLAEKRSRGSFVGLVGDGLPAAGTFGGGRSPTEIRLAWDWDFTHPADARCSVSATLTSEGTGSSASIARGVSLGWRGEAGVPVDTTLATAIPGVGIVRLRCDAFARELVLEPDGAPPGLALTIFEGSERSDRPLGNVPYVLPLPNNGLVEAVAQGGVALRLLVSSRWKTNDPDPAQNFCRLSGLVVAG